MNVKKNIIFVFVAIALIIVLVVLTINHYCMKKPETSQNIENKIHSFDLTTYSYELEKFKSDKYVDKYSNADDVRTEAEKIWVEIYGDDVIEQKPYEVSFDEDNNVWLVNGVFHEKNAFGGVAYILIEKDTGKVLAVWHTK
jgi:hypothetical protein